MAPSPLLEVRDIRVRYGNIEAVKGISLEVGEGEIVTLIGGNGAGKTTTLKTISGLLKPATGQILFQGERIEELAPHQIVGLGITQSPEGRRIFPRMSVQENLMMGGFTSKQDRGLNEALDRVLALFPVLDQRKSQAGGTLSGGEQQMLAIGRALMSRPKLMLLDEPSMGLAPLMVEKIFETIGEINRQGATILLVEQNAHMALSLASRGYVMETGVISLADSAQALTRNPDVRKAYLGL
ncbi:MAG: ABC transporter ATP-binding protein [Actinomycetota bacterium]